MAYAYRHNTNTAVTDLLSDLFKHSRHWTFTSYLVASVQALQMSTTMDTWQSWEPIMVPDVVWLIGWNYTWETIIKQQIFIRNPRTIRWQEPVVMHYVFKLYSFIFYNIKETHR